MSERGVCLALPCLLAIYAPLPAYNMVLLSLSHSILGSAVPVIVHSQDCFVLRDN